MLRQGLLIRWLKFHAVAAIGMVLQLSLLHLLTRQLGMHYLLATALAVEAAIVQNFFWHDRWTWRTASQEGMLRRFLQYQFGTGLISLVSNLLAMRFLTGALGLPLLVANLIAIVGSGLANFLLGEFFVFNRRDATSTTALHAGPGASSNGSSEPSARPASLS